RIGFGLFSGSATAGSIAAPKQGGQTGDIAFVPLAMPLMCGPGAIATALSMVSLVKHSELELGAFLIIAVAVVAVMAVTYLCLAFSDKLIRGIRPMGIDAGPRTLGLFFFALGGRVGFPPV